MLLTIAKCGSLNSQCFGGRMVPIVPSFKNRDSVWAGELVSQQRAQMKRLFNCLYAKKDREAVYTLWSFPQIQIWTHTLPFSESLLNNRYMQTDCPLTASTSLPLLQSFPPKLLTNTQQALTAVCTSTCSRPPTHMLFFILRGSFSEPSPAQRTPVLLLPIHQHNACPAKLLHSPSIRFVWFCISHSFDRTQVKQRWNGKLSWCEIYLFIMCHVYFLAFSFSLWPLTSCYCSYDEKLIPVLTFFCPNKRHEAQATCPTC